MAAPKPQRRVRLAVTRVSYDLVLTATADTGVMKLAGEGQVVDPAEPAKVLEELGAVDLTVWGSTTAQLKMRAKAWPPHFDRVTGDYFGVSRAGDHRFDLFLASDRFIRLLDLAHGSRQAVLHLRCERSADGTLDLVSEVEISATRG